MSMPVLDAGELAAEDRTETVIMRLEALAPGDCLVVAMPLEPYPMLQALLKRSPRGHNFAPLEKGAQTWRWQFARRRNEPRTVTEYLVWDHRRLEDILSETLELAGSGNWSHAQAHFTDYAVGLRHHADYEDHILFPEYDRLAGGLGDGLIELMMKEHVDIRRGIDALLLAANGRDRDEFDAEHASLTDLASEHHAKEEEILLPSVDAALDAAGREVLVQRMLLAR